jgi:hypothetical protein
MASDPDPFKALRFLMAVLALSLAYGETGIKIMASNVAPQIPRRTT